MFERLISTKKQNLSNEQTLLGGFATVVKQECKVAEVFFSFYEIPELIERKRYTREQYEKIRKFLLKVKALYLKMRQEQKQAEKEAKASKNAFDDDVS